MSKIIVDPIHASIIHKHIDRGKKYIILSQQKENISHTNTIIRHLTHTFKKITQHLSKVFEQRGGKLTPMIQKRINELDDILAHLNKINPEEIIKKNKNLQLQNEQLRAELANLRKSQTSLTVEELNKNIINLQQHISELTDQQDIGLHKYNDLQKKLDHLDNNIINKQKQLTILDQKIKEQNLDEQVNLKNQIATLLSTAEQQKIETEKTKGRFLEAIEKVQNTIVKQQEELKKRRNELQLLRADNNQMKQERKILEERIHALTELLKESGAMEKLEALEEIIRKITK